MPPHHNFSYQLRWPKTRNISSNVQQDKRQRKKAKKKRKNHAENGTSTMPAQSEKAEKKQVEEPKGVEMKMDLENTD